MEWTRLNIFITRTRKPRSCPRNPTKAMKIKSPLVNKKEVERLCRAGADEFFCGIEPYGWRKQYRDFYINQRSVHASFSKLPDLEKAIGVARRYKAKVHRPL